MMRVTCGSDRLASHITVPGDFRRYHPKMVLLYWEKRRWFPG